MSRKYNQPERKNEFGPELASNLHYEADIGVLTVPPSPSQT